MRAESLRIRQFRNHRLTEIMHLASRVNLITGANGAGKTSILEALSVAALSKCFTTAPDTSLVQSGNDRYEIAADFVNEHNVLLHLAIDFTLGPPARKNIILNNSRLRSSSELIGLVPMVTLTPDDKVITGGSPEHRRRFLNIVLSQASRTYLESEINYRKALRHRNALLSDALQKGLSRSRTAELLEPWTQSLIQYGVPIAQKRSSFIREFRSYFLNSYRRISDGNEDPALEYLPLGEQCDTQDFTAFFAEAFNRVSADEYRRGVTLAGPHKDDIAIRIDDNRPAREYASQGQHKTLLVALRLAEYAYLNDAVRQTPILLLDDVFSELDAQRAAKTLELLSSPDFGQTFITSALTEPFLDALDFSGDDNRLIRVQRGMIV